MYYLSILFLLTTTAFSQSLENPTVLPLWENGPPGFEKQANTPEEAKDWWVKSVHNPTVNVFKPKEPNGSAILIFPGGGHGVLVYKGEGLEAADFLTSLGITAIVIKYRLFREENSPYAIQHPVEDAIRAIRLVRANAKDWQIDKDRIGVMGFSAGGELVNLIAYESHAGNLSSPDSVEHYPANVNFQIQIYPGPLGIPENVSSEAPPAFLLASNNDECCSDTVLDLLKAYRKSGAPVEAHFYAKDEHGFNMGNRSQYTSIQNWPDRLADWLKDHQFFAKQ